MLNSLQFVSLVVSLIFFAIKYFNPAFPLTYDQLLGYALFLLGLVGIVPQVWTGARRAALAAAGGVWMSLSFWTAVSGVISIALLYYFPTFPLDQAALLGLIVFILARFGIVPEVRARLAAAAKLKK